MGVWGFFLCGLFVDGVIVAVDVVGGAGDAGGEGGVGDAVGDIAAGGADGEGGVSNGAGDVMALCCR